MRSKNGTMGYSMQWSKWGSFSHLKQFTDMFPQIGQDEESVLQIKIFRCEWRHVLAIPAAVKEMRMSASIKIGEEVWIKPPEACCKSQ